ncbi:putative 3-oxolaurate decarboxylase [Rosa chinensis]|uniref:Putative 3-oxolaurate decarboxylase n=1 Tax=Rosa chinensis TaxID=74649 RepID=A0A2P6RN58_ROSCH|nr:putative 3-oxolaurate decarboxylase [Rosa chinensis]
MFRVIIRSKYFHITPKPRNRTNTPLNNFQKSSQINNEFLGYYTHKPSKNPSMKKHFVLVHGASHGAWCWYKLATLLTSAGHNVTTLDLPTSGIVISKLEFGKSNYFTDTQYRFDEGPDKPATSFLYGPEFISFSLYQLSPPEDLTLELTLLRFAPLFHEELILSKKNYGSVRRVYIKCDQDQTIKEDLARLMINDNPPDEVKVINGSDHMVMFSRPLELFSSLYQIAQNYS